MDLTAIREAIRAVAKKIVTVKTGTVVSDMAKLSQTQVVLDSDDSRTPVEALGLGEKYPAATRVACLAYPTGGLLVLGSLDLDRLTDYQTAQATTVRSWVATTNQTDQNGISTQVDITGLSITWTADPARRYKFTLNQGFSKSTTVDFVTIVLTNASNAVVVQRSEYMQIGDYGVVSLVWSETGLSGSTTRKARVHCNSGTVNVINSFQRNGILIVEDIGPA